MMIRKRASVSMSSLPKAAAAAGLALLLAGCASSGAQTSNVAYAETITPIQNMPVASTNLPAIGQDGQVMQQQDFSTLQQPAPLGQPAPLNPAMGQQVDQFGNPIQTASADGSFVTLDAVGSVPDSPGRDLTGGLSIEKLLGGWTIVSGANQCKLNLTYTAKSGTSRYRASTPGCSMAGLQVVASWQLVGTQVQLFDENNDIVASLILSGNRFIGTLAGGQGISMVG